MQPIANAQCLFSRLTIRANNTLVKGIHNYSMCYSVFEKCLTRAAREREAGLGFPMATLASDGVADYEPMTDGQTYACSVNLLSGLLLQPK